VSQAVHAGFRHIDTACQPRHYNEPAVGQGWTSAAQELGLSRDDIWLQTKYTSLNGQDPNRVPYDKKAPLGEQVRQSVAKSLENLQTSYIDSLVMHGPENSWEKNLLVWRAMESFVDKGTVGQLGISNFYDPDAVKYLYEQARIKPAVVQNRFYADSGFDVAIRKFCLEHGMEYQSFWTLGANRNAIGNGEFKALAAEKGISAETLMYAFVMAIGITPLDGTTNVEHMKEDMAFLKRARAGNILLSNEEVTRLAQIVGLPEWSEENIVRRV
jgi:diketogulonate reductase-like aldo/keto reductase